MELTHAIDFITNDEALKDRKVTYTSFVSNHRPLKGERLRIWLVAGEDRLTYDTDSGSPATDLLNTKSLLNSIIAYAHSGARLLSMDLRDIILSTQMHKPESMIFSEDIRKKYNSEDLKHNGYIYMDIK